MLKIPVRKARVHVRMRNKQEGSVLQGTVKASCLGVETQLELESDEPAERVAALVRNAENGCFTLQALLARAGFEAELSAQIQKDIWYKLWGNMTVNPVSALTGATTDLILGDELVRDFISRVMLEAREIGARIGIPIAQQPEDRHAVTLKLGAFKTSMLQDVEAGRPVELDALVTVVRELGARTGVPTPYTDVLLGLARLQARVRGLY